MHMSHVAYPGFCSMKRLGVFLLHPGSEANHLEACNFPLYVWNYAADYSRPMKNHFAIFAHIRKLWKGALRKLLAWISRETNLFKMASQAKKLPVMKIRKICVSEKALREEVVLYRSKLWDHLHAVKPRLCRTWLPRINQGGTKTATAAKTKATESRGELDSVKIQ